MQPTASVDVFVYFFEDFYLAFPSISSYSREIHWRGARPPVGIVIGSRIRVATSFWLGRSYGHVRQYHPFAPSSVAYAPDWAISRLFPQVLQANVLLLNAPTREGCPRERFAPVATVM